MASLIVLAVFSSAITSVFGRPGCSAVSLLQVSKANIVGAHQPSQSLGFELGPHNARQQKIVDMMRHTWKGYSKNCFGEDELLPVDHTCSNGWHLGLTLVDSLDTLFLMGMKPEFNAARDWVANRTALDFHKVGTVSLFETTIRVVGGLLSAHALSGDRVFLDRAQELGDRLLPAFGGITGHGPPSTDVDVGNGRRASTRDPQLAESTTLGLEFKTLSALTHTPKYAQAVELIGEAMHKAPKWDGLLQNGIESMDMGTLYGPYKLGAGGDSYYEYLLKQWLLTGREDAVLLQDYKEAMEGIRRHLVKKSKGPLQLTYVAEMSGNTVERKMDHLVCFLPGTLALGAHYKADADTPWHLDLAKELMKTCYEMYKKSGHMLAPEITKFDTEGQEVFIEQQDSHDLLRPETLESLFYLYRLTGDKTYQDWGWQMAEAIERYAKVEGGGYASLDSVLLENPQQRNHMESFWSAETLKYLFLLFDDSRTQVPLDKFVFNTEAHPLHIMTEKPVY